MKLKEFINKFKSLLKDEIIPGFIGTDKECFIKNGITKELHNLYLKTNNTTLITDIEDNSLTLEIIEGSLNKFIHMFLFNVKKAINNNPHMFIFTYYRELKNHLHVLHKNILTLSNDIKLTNQEYRKDTVKYLYNQLFNYNESIYCFYLYAMLDKKEYNENYFLNIKRDNNLVDILDNSLTFIYNFLDNSIMDNINYLLSIPFPLRHKYNSDYYCNMSIIQDTIRIPIEKIRKKENTLLEKISVF